MPIRHALRKVGLTRLTTGQQNPTNDLGDGFASINGGAAVGADIVAITSVDIRCIVSADAEIGDLIGLCIPTEDDSDPTMVNGIIHWKELRRRGYEVGIYVVDGVPDNLMALSNEPRRKMSRYRCKVVGSISGSEMAAEIPATVVNYSFDGMGIQTSAPCPMNEVVTFTWQDDFGWQKVSGMVLWQIEQHDGFLIGCQAEPGAGLALGGLRPRNTK